MWQERARSSTATALGWAACWLSFSGEGVVSCSSNTCLCPDTRVMAAATASAAATPLLEKHEMIEMHAQLEKLRLDMAARQAKGRATSGRYKKHDTARKNFIETVALPALRLGKRIDAADWRRLFLPGDDEIHGPDKADMDAWYKLHKQDPRASSYYDDLVIKRD